MRFPDLHAALALARVTKPTNPRSASLAISNSGRVYKAGCVESFNHILHIPSELAVLLLATAQNDFGIEHIATIHEELPPGEAASPQVLKILIDHSRRTGVPIEYKVFDQAEEQRFSCEDVSSFLPYYQPVIKPLKKTREAQPSVNMGKVGNQDIATLLRTNAHKGLERTFLTKDDASGYGCCVVTADGNYYFTGQYSSFDHRANVHAEMAALVIAMMNTQSPVTHLGLMSTKHLTHPCEMCGICRQFLQEICLLLKFAPEIFTFALEKDEYEKHSLTEYLPSQWHNTYERK